MYSACEIAVKHQPSPRKAADSEITTRCILFLSTDCSNPDSIDTHMRIARLTRPNLLLRNSWGPLSSYRGPVRAGSEHSAAKSHGGSPSPHDGYNGAQVIHCGDLKSIHVHGPFQDAGLRWLMPFS